MKHRSRAPSGSGVALTERCNMPVTAPECHMSGIEVGDQMLRVTDLEQMLRVTDLEQIDKTMDDMGTGWKVHD